jgi:pimeloyl-ACP methyl ester carboxylesterase
MGATAAIDDAGFIKIGGIDQWVEVHSRRPGSPILLFLHGGPGEAMSPFRDLFSPYEDDLTIAIWDQRGSGKTYGRSGGDHTPGMELEQFIADTIEVADALRQRYGKSKIALMGHSWGAALGLYAAQRRPDLFSVFVGTGQPVSNALAVPADERHARAVLTAKGNKEGLKKLDAVADLPATDNKRRFAARSFLFGDEDKTFLAREEAFAPDPLKATGDAAGWAHGFQFTSDVFVPKILGHETVDIVGYDIRVPFVVIQGRDDWICPTEVARDYVAKVKAPAKAFAEVRGGHFACYTDQPQVLAALREHALKFCHDA